MRELTQRRRDEQNSRFRECRRSTRVLLGPFTIVCIASVLLGCGNGSPSPTSDAVTFEVGEIKVIDDRRQLLGDPLLVQAVNEALTKYTELPTMESCVDLALWYRDGMETILDGNLLQLIEDDKSISSARGILLQIVTLHNDVLVEIINMDASICSRENFLQNLELIPEAGPVAVIAHELLEARGGMFDSSPAGQLSLALDIAEGVPLTFEIRGVDYELEIGTVPHTEP